MPKKTNFTLGSEKYYFNHKIDSEKAAKPYSSHNLDHQFSVLALSETWTLKNKNSLSRSQKLYGYQPCDGKQQNSLKSGRRFYINDGINY